MDACQLLAYELFCLVNCSVVGQWRDQVEGHELADGNCHCVKMPICNKRLALIALSPETEPSLAKHYREGRNENKGITPLHYNPRSIAQYYLLYHCSWIQLDLDNCGAECILTLSTTFRADIAQVRDIIPKYLPILNIDTTCADILKLG